MGSWGLGPHLRVPSGGNNGVFTSQKRMCADQLPCGRLGGRAGYGDERNHNQVDAAQEMGRIRIAQPLDLMRNNIPRYKELHQCPSESMKKHMLGSLAARMVRCADPTSALLLGCSLAVVKVLALSKIRSKRGAL